MLLFLERDENDGRTDIFYLRIDENATESSSTNQFALFYDEGFTKTLRTPDIWTYYLNF